MENEMNKEPQPIKKVRQGIVVSDKMDKTRVVLVTRTFRIPVYEKVARKSKRFYAHDGKNESRTGDLVEIVETRPLSKLKRWRIRKILKKGQKVL
jgi:small subunit ribosomal protein S17